MKRSEFKPSAKQPLHRAELKQGAKTMRRRRSRPKLEKVDSTFRSEPLLDAVRKLPCMCCGIPHRTQAAHSNQLRFGKGRNLRASDAAIMALCTVPDIAVPGCHEKHDQGGKREKLESWAFEYVMISRTLLALIAARRLTGDPDIIRALPPIETCSEALCVALIEHVESGRLTVNPDL